MVSTIYFTVFLRMLLGIHSFKILQDWIKELNSFQYLRYPFDAENSHIMSFPLDFGQF